MLFGSRPAAAGEGGACAESPAILLGLAGDDFGGLELTQRASAREMFRA